MIKKAKTTVNKLKVAIIAMFSFCFLFICIGYATLSETLTINVNMSANAQDDVFIVEVLDSSENFSLNSYGGATFIGTITQGDINETLTLPLATANTNGDYYYYKDLTLYVKIGDDFVVIDSFSNDYGISVSNDLLQNIMFGRGAINENGPQHSDVVKLNIKGSTAANITIAVKLNYEKIADFDNDVVVVNLH